MISVGIPTYNRRDSVLKVLEALQSASNANEIEAIVVDDGSTDGTSAAILPEAARCVTHEKNLGYAAAFIRLFEECRTEYLLITADDDCVDTRAFSELRQFLQSEAPDFVSTQWTTRNGALLRGRDRTDAVSLSEFSSAANHAPGLVYRVDACRSALDILKSRLIESSEIARLFPQVVILTCLLAQKADCRWWNRIIVSEGEAHPSGITGAEGRSYRDPYSRLIQHTSMTNHLRRLPGAVDVRTRLLQTHGRYFYFVVRGYLDDLEPNLSEMLDVSARRWLLRSAARKTLARLRSH